MASMASMASTRRQASQAAKQHTPSARPRTPKTLDGTARRRATHDIISSALNANKVELPRFSPALPRLVTHLRQRLPTNHVRRPPPFLLRLHCCRLPYRFGLAHRHSQSQSRTTTHLHHHHPVVPHGSMRRLPMPLRRFSASDFPTCNHHPHSSTHHGSVHS